jgi:aryl-alcohol dehydrogenase-like predicted oxidoreductase
VNIVGLGATGEKVSQLALGCMGMGTLAGDETSFALLDRYAADGGTFLDTADCYAWWWAKGTPGGQSEELIGRWLARSGRRDRMFIATKGAGRIRDLEAVWPAGSDVADWGAAQFAGAAAGTLRSALEGSLRRLGVEHIDLYYVHVDDRCTALEETLGALAGFVREGKVRYLGWSNVRTWRLERIRGLCAANGWAAAGRAAAAALLPPAPGRAGRALDHGRRAARLPARACRPQPGRLLAAAQGPVRRAGRRTPGAPGNGTLRR